MFVGEKDREKLEPGKGTFENVLETSYGRSDEGEKGSIRLSKKGEQTFYVFPMGLRSPGPKNV